MLTEKAEIQITVAFGKTSAICSHQQWYMNKSRWGKAQQLVQIKLLRCGTEQVTAADNFRDAHQGIVNDHGQLIGVNTVAALQDDIAAFSSQVLRIRTIMSVDKADSSTGSRSRCAGSLVRALAAVCSAVKWRQVPAYRMRPSLRCGAWAACSSAGCKSRGKSVPVFAAVQNRRHRCQNGGFDNRVHLFRRRCLRYPIPGPASADHLLKACRCRQGSGACQGLRYAV